MAQTTTRTRRAAEDDEEPKRGVATAAESDDDDDDEEEEDTTPRGRSAPSRAAAIDDDDDDDDLDDGDEDDAIVIGEGWEEAEAPSGQYPTVPRGTYVAMLSDVLVKTAGEKAKFPGSKYPTLVFKIQAEDNPSKMEEDDPTVTIFHNLFFTGNAYGRSKQFLSKMGIVLQVGDKPIPLLREQADDEARFEIVVGMEKVRREDPETGKLRNVNQNKILSVLGPTDI